MQKIYVIATAILIIVGIWIFNSGVSLYRAAAAETALFYSLLAVAAGLVFESYRVTRNGRQTAWTLVAALVGSLLFASPKPGPPFHAMGVFTFAGGFLLIYFSIFLSINRKRITPDRSEGQAWLLSLCFVYWLVDLYLSLPTWMLPVAALTAVPVFLSGYNAFVRRPLSDGMRTWLSVWCVLITLILGIDNGVSVLFPATEWSSSDTFDYPARMFAFFLLGISAIYVANNLWQLLELNPFNDVSKREKRQIRRRHLLRFSPGQVPAWQSAVCLAYAAALFGLNVTYAVLPRITMIWLVIVTFPPLLALAVRAFTSPAPKSPPPRSRARGRKRSVRFPRIKSK